MSGPAPLLFGTALMVAALLGYPGEANAVQAGDLRIELGAGRILPPSGTSATAADYVTGSIQVDRWWSDAGGVFGVASGGLDPSGEGGDWGSAGAGFAARLLGDAAGPSVGLEGVAYAFRVGGDFGYEAWTVEASPVLEIPAGPVVLGLRGEAGFGHSTAEFRSTDIARFVESDLEVWGGGPELRIPVSGAAFTVDAAWIRSRNRTFRRIGARIAGGGEMAWRAEIDRWDAPRRGVTTGEISLSLSMGSTGRWIAGIRGGRTEPDPLALTRPGEHGGVTLARTLVTFEGDESSSMVEVVDSDGGTATVRISVPDRGATHVELLGDFTDWEALAMTRDGDDWEVEVEVPVGTYHFGFLVDDAWFVPESAPGLTSDDWGRTNATLVVY